MTSSLLIRRLLAWLLGVALNLALAGFYDIAVRDVVMAIAAYTLAKLAEVREEAPAAHRLEVAMGSMS